MRLLLRFAPSCYRLAPLTFILLLLPAWASGAALGKHYREMLVVKHQLWVLTEAGRIRVYDAVGKPQPLSAVEAVTAQHLAADGERVVAQVGLALKRWNGAVGAWETVGKLAESVLGLAVNSRHQVFAITALGVLDVQTGRRILPKPTLSYRPQGFTKFNPPAAYFMDAQDNLWIGYGYGEWGGDIFTYSTAQHKFLELRLNGFDLAPIKSFFQLKTSVGVSTGLQHFMTSGSLAEFTDLGARTIYSTWADRDTAKTRPHSATDQPYIGPAAYDASLNRLYFYSHLGVYEAEYGKNLARLTAWRQ